MIANQIVHEQYGNVLPCRLFLAPVSREWWETTGNRMVVKYKPTEQIEIVSPAKKRLEVTADSDVLAVFLD